MDPVHVKALRDLLRGTGWLERTSVFAQALVGSTREPGGLLLVGTPDGEPWHLAAHLMDEARFAGAPQLAPTLVRWSVPANAPAHLAVTLERLTQARRGETLLVVAPDAASRGLLERVDGARRSGATVLAMDSAESELTGIAHEALVVPSGAHTRVTAAPTVTMDVAQHLVSLAAGGERRHGAAAARVRLARLLDRVGGG